MRINASGRANTHSTLQPQKKEKVPLELEAKVQIANVLSSVKLTENSLKQLQNAG